MLESIHVPEAKSLIPKIVVFGIGGAGCNAVSNMQSEVLEGVDFVVANTDAQSLTMSGVERRVQLGVKTTQGLGAGADPEIGRQSAEESRDEIAEQLDGAHLCFITAGMGGGTGTGAAPVVAEIAREKKILTVGVVTKPFFFEGENRARLAQEGVDHLKQFVHTLVVLPNQNLFKVTNDALSFQDVCHMADEVLFKGIRSITDLMTKPGMINLDFADVRTILLEMGTAIMGTGEDGGSERAKDAAILAMDNKLLEDFQLNEAKGVLINVIGGNDLSLMDVQIATDTIKDQIGHQAKIIVGSTIDQDYSGKVKVTLIATGLGCPAESSVAGNEFAEAEQFSEAQEQTDAVHEPEDYAGVRDFPEQWPGDFEESLPVQQPAASAVINGGVYPTNGAGQAVCGQDRGFPRREYVAPKTVDTIIDETIHEPSPVSGEPGFQANGTHAGAEKTSGLRSIRSVIGRMANAATARPNHHSVGDPSFTAGSVVTEIEDSEEQRSIPAYIRRQAN